MGLCSLVAGASKPNTRKCLWTVFVGGSIPCIRMEFFVGFSYVITDRVTCRREIDRAVSVVSCWVHLKYLRAFLEVVFSSVNLLTAKAKPTLNLAEQIWICYAYLWCWHSLHDNNSREAFNEGLHYVQVPEKSHKCNLWVTYKPTQLIFGFRPQGCSDSRCTKAMTLFWLKVHQVLLEGNKRHLHLPSDIV